MTLWEEPLRRGIVALAFVCLLPYTAQAAEISLVSEAAGDQPAIIQIKGKLEPIEAAANIMTFRMIAASQKPSTLVTLEVPGGAVVTAIEIGRIIRAHKFSALVANGAQCTSACGLIWLGGVYRYLGPAARVGFHAARDARTGAVAGPGNALIGAYLHEIGITHTNTIAFLTHAGATAETMNWITATGAAPFGIFPLIWTGTKDMVNATAYKTPLTGDAHGFPAPPTPIPATNPNRK